VLLDDLINGKADFMKEGDRVVEKPHLFAVEAIGNVLVQPESDSWVRN
jgi:hypothetical protein